MTLIFSLIYDSPVFRKFLRYYKQPGIERYVCLLHTPDLRPVVERALAGQSYAIDLISVGVFTGQKDSDAQDAARQKYVPTDQWYSVADPDEFYFHPKYTTLCAMREAAIAVDADYVRGEYVDRVARDGSLPTVDPERTLDEQFPIAADVTTELCKGYLAKVVVARGNVPVILGHHWAAGKRAPFIAEVHHFKWVGALLPILKQRVVDWKRLKTGYHEEPDRFLRHYAKYGRINLEEPTLQARPARPIGA